MPGQNTRRYEPELRLSVSQKTGPSAVVILCVGLVGIVAGIAAYRHLKTKPAPVAEVSAAREADAAKIGERLEVARTAAEAIVAELGAVSGEIAAFEAKRKRTKAETDELGSLRATRDILKGRFVISASACRKALEDFSKLRPAAMPKPCPTLDEK